MARGGWYFRLGAEIRIDMFVEQPRHPDRLRVAGCAICRRRGGNEAVDGAVTHDFTAT